MFVLRAEIVTIFEPKMVTISARNTNIYKICKLCETIFFQAFFFATKFCNFTNFVMFFLAVVFDSLPLLRLKFSLTCKLSIKHTNYLVSYLPLLVKGNFCPIYLKRAQLSLQIAFHFISSYCVFTSLKSLPPKTWPHTLCFVPLGRTIQ